MNAKTAKRLRRIARELAAAQGIEKDSGYVEGVMTQTVVMPNKQTMEVPSKTVALDQMSKKGMYSTLKKKYNQVANA